MCLWHNEGTASCLRICENNSNIITKDLENYLQVTDMKVAINTDY